MANFAGMIVTQKGLALIAKLLVSGQPTEFTEIAIGDGIPSESEDIEKRTQLVHEHTSASILTREIKSSTTVQLETRFKASDFPEAVILNEIGVFAKDPDDGKILYAYDHVTRWDDGTPKGDNIPAEGGGTFVFRTFRVLIQVAKAANVSFVVDGSATYALHKAQERHTSALDQREFTLETVNAAGVLSVFVEGAAYFDWATDGQIVTFADAMPEGREIVFVETYITGGGGDD